MAAARYTEKRLFDSLCAFKKLQEKKPMSPERGKIIGCQAAEGSLLLPSLVEIRFGKELE